jgi:hypothetical protein
MAVGARTASKVHNLVIETAMAHSANTDNAKRNDCSIVDHVAKHAARTAGQCIGRPFFSNVQRLSEADFRGTDTHLTRYPDARTQIVTGLPRTIGDRSYPPNLRTRVTSLVLELDDVECVKEWLQDVVPTATDVVVQQHQIPGLDVRYTASLGFPDQNQRDTATPTLKQHISEVCRDGWRVIPTLPSRVTNTASFNLIHRVIPRLLHNAPHRPTTEPGRSLVAHLVVWGDAASSKSVLLAYLICPELFGRSTSPWEEVQVSRGKEGTMLRGQLFDLVMKELDEIGTEGMLVEVGTGAGETFLVLVRFYGVLGDHFFLNLYTGVSGGNSDQRSPVDMSHASHYGTVEPHGKLHGTLGWLRSRMETWGEEIDKVELKIQECAEAGLEQPAVATQRRDAVRQLKLTSKRVMTSLKCEPNLRLGFVIPGPFHITVHHSKLVIMLCYTELIAKGKTRDRLEDEAAAASKLYATGQPQASGSKLRAMINELAHTGPTEIRSNAEPALHKFAILPVLCARMKCLVYGDHSTGPAQEQSSLEFRVVSHFIFMLLAGWTAQRGADKGSGMAGMKWLGQSQHTHHLFWLADLFEEAGSRGIGRPQLVEENGEAYFNSHVKHAAMRRNK